MSPTSSSPASITFSFAPSFIIVISEYPYEYSGYKSGYFYSNLSNNYNCLDCSGLSTSFVDVHWCRSGSSGVNTKKSSDGKTIYWYGNYEKTWNYPTWGFIFLGYTV